MVTFNVVCITLTNVIFVVNADMKCKEQLKFKGQFNFIPVKERAKFEKEILHAYQQELLKKFLEAHEKHLQDMFEHPMVWCRENIGKLGDKRRQNLPVEQNCIESMNSDHLLTFSVVTKVYTEFLNQNVCVFEQDSRKSALEGIFYGLRNVYTCAYLKGMQKHYLNYVAPIVEKYVVHTSARSPWKYCNDISSPALPLPTDHNGNVVYNLHLNEHQSTPFPSGSNDPHQSSGDASKPMLDIDLNYSPPPEDD